MLDVDFSHSVLNTGVYIRLVYGYVLDAE